MKIKKKLSIIHPYLENRREEIDLGLYPKHHLWGLAGLEREERWSTNLVECNEIYIHSLLEKVINRLLFRQSPGVKAEIAGWRAAKSANLIYSVCGPLSLCRFYNNTKTVSWVFRKPSKSSENLFDPYSSKNLSSHSAFLCLTPTAEKCFSMHSYAKFSPWCVDLEMFDGKAPQNKPDSNFFLATGKTGRDYKTLIKAAESLSVELRIIGPKEECPKQLAPNIKWIETSEDPPDQAINYPTLREWYAQCIAVCIPLSGDADDTCGYTNMLEAMAMGKPVLMTSSGCLHLNPKINNFGISIEKGNVSQWKHSMMRILNNPGQAQALGSHGRKITVKDLSVPDFEKRIVRFMQRIIDN